jgi:hypothetical protein
VVTKLSKAIDGLDTESSEYLSTAYKLSEIMERIKQTTAQGVIDLTGASAE